MEIRNRGSGFSHRERKASLKRMIDTEYDLLVVGGGITGTATARDAASRGLKVALLERGDFACRTSSNSSKLVHGGLRYLENFEFKLVFESLSERAHLLKVAPNMVRPMPFVIPVYKGTSRGMGLLSLGLWLYDTLSLFRTPGRHQRYSRKELMREHPLVDSENLVGGFQYYDASMWDDVMAVEAARAASRLGVDVVTYFEAVKPQLEISGNKTRVTGYFCRDLLDAESTAMTLVRAKQIVLCVGPYTDLCLKTLGGESARPQESVLKPSTGVHLVFESSRFPVKTSYLLPVEKDGRVVFVLPRPDFGPGCVMVGTTDGASEENPDDVTVRTEETQYLLDVANRYFPTLKLTREDVISATVGIRPLFNPGSQSTLQSVSREHHIDVTRSGVVYVVGGKYTTHRQMARDIVDQTLKIWLERAYSYGGPMPPSTHHPDTSAPANPSAVGDLNSKHAFLNSRYGSDGEKIEKLASLENESCTDPDGFPCLLSQLRHCIREEMVLKLEDFYLRRIPLFLVRRDHGLPWVDQLSRVWAQEMGYEPNSKEAKDEAAALRSAIERERKIRGL